VAPFDFVDLADQPGIQLKFNLIFYFFKITF